MQLMNAIKEHGKKVSRSLQSAMEVNAGLQKTPLKPTINMELQRTARVVLAQVFVMQYIK